MSRRRRAEESGEEDEGEEEAEDWVDDEVLGCSVWVAGRYQEWREQEAWVLKVGGVVGE